MFLNSKQKKRTWIGSIGASVCYMMFSTHGSFDPREIGFYTSIIFGFLVVFFTSFILTKYSNKNKENS